MKIKRELLLKQCESVAPGLSAREILEQSAHLVFRGGKVTTFNDEVLCQADCCLAVEGAVVAAPLLALLRKLTEEELDIEAVEGELTVKGKGRRAGVRMESEITLPVEAVETPSKWRKMPEGLADAVKLVGHCAGTDESKFVLTCVHLHPEWIEACDGFQLARVPLETKLPDPTLIRRKSLDAVLGMGPAEWAKTDSWLHFRLPSGLAASCRRYAEKYPSLDKLLEVEGREVELPKGIEDVLDRTRVFSSRDAVDDLVTMVLRSGQMKLTGRGPDGWYSEVQKVKYEGDEVQFVVAPKLLLEIARLSDKCIVGPGRLKVATEKMVFVTCTGAVEKKDE